ncbi:rho guanine nucleotide exchange factor 10-like protein [Trichonephila clavata]|uniref:Rho guanine nucleotide exchange factor 10-like protein n=1 Tax=Trichonephila clavata TaxID=2740835 RepID=A0A8X6M295_TRICU|nr:rho guanine nucleotide exchange factor 10-like protein [Trichonephila clavata]
MGGVDLADQLANVYKLDRKSCKWWKKSIFSPIDECSGRLMNCVLRTQTSKTLLIDFILPLAEALMASGELNAQYQRRRGTGRLSKTSGSLLNVSDHLPVTTKTRRRCHKCA